MPKCRVRVTRYVSESVYVVASARTQALAEDKAMDVASKLSDAHWVRDACNADAVFVANPRLVEKISDDEPETVLA